MIGIVIALKSEADKILKGIVETDSIHNSHKINVFKINQGKDQIAVILSGTGKVNAAIATQYLLDTCKINKVINIGVCGATKVAAKQHTVYIDSVVEADYDTSAVDGDSFEVNNINLFNPKHTHDVCNILYTADHFVTEKPLINDHQVEGYFDMEGYAVAVVCKENCIPVTIIKSVTDVIEDEGQASQYLINFDNACNRLRKVLKGELGK